MEKQIVTKRDVTSGNWGAYLIFLLTGYVISGILLLLLAFFLYRFQLNESVVKIGIIIVYMVSTFAIGFLAGKKAKNKKFLWGFLMGVGYYLVLALMSLIMHSAGSGVELATTFLLCAGGGTLGGMLS